MVKTPGKAREEHKRYEGRSPRIVLPANSAHNIIDHESTDHLFEGSCLRKPYVLTSLRLDIPLVSSLDNAVEAHKRYQGRSLRIVFPTNSDYNIIDHESTNHNVMNTHLLIS